MNRVFLLGELTRFESSRTRDGSPMCKLRVSTCSRGVGASSMTHHTAWHTVIAFDDVASACDDLSGEGEVLFVQGFSRTIGDRERGYRALVIAEAISRLDGASVDLAELEVAPPDISDLLEHVEWGMSEDEKELWREAWCWRVEYDRARSG